MMANRRRSLSILATCVALVIAALGMNNLWACMKGGDRLPAEMNGAGVTESSEERNAEFAAQEKETQQTETNLEAEPEPASVLSQAPYENLEQPDELRGVQEFFLFKSQFIISYNVERRVPNYVCWSLSQARASGKVQRSNNFHADSALGELARVESFDYNGSGYDRGHMCPAGDNKNTEMAMDESFCMTNICPQDHSLNVGAWNDLEMQCRSWAKNYGTLYICCGPIFDSKSPKTIGQRRDMKIAVPDRFFKVILTLGRVPKAIGFIYPNRPCGGDMRDYAMSVDRVEKAAGMDFFFQLDDKQEKELERECNPAAWGI